MEKISITSPAAEAIRAEYYAQENIVVQKDLPIRNALMEVNRKTRDLAESKNKLEALNKDVSDARAAQRELDNAHLVLTGFTVEVAATEKYRSRI